MWDFYFWCQLSDLNQRPSDYKSDALPAELNWQCEIIIYFLFDNFKFFLHSYQFYDKIFS